MRHIRLWYPVCVILLWSAPVQAQDLPWQDVVLSNGAPDSEASVQLTEEFPGAICDLARGNNQTQEWQQQLFLAPLLFADDNETHWLSRAGGRCRGEMSPSIQRHALQSNVFGTNSRTSRIAPNVIPDFRFTHQISIPRSGHNVAQTYLFQNTSGETKDFRTMLFLDPDISLYFDRIGVNHPESTMFAVPDGVCVTDPGTGPCPYRLSIAAEADSQGAYEGFVAFKASASVGASSMLPYFRSNDGIPATDLNTFQSADSNPLSLLGDDLDVDGDYLIDVVGEVAGAMQWSFEVPAGDTASLTVQYFFGDLENRFDLTTVSQCDVTRDAACDVDDLDLLTSDGDLVAGLAVDDPLRATLDMTGDGAIDQSDIDRWLELAALENGLPNPYLRGDANLDGYVDGQDFIRWNQSKFETGTIWSQGDFNGDGVTDGADFIKWNQNKFRSSFETTSVPEPGSVLIIAAVSVLMLTSRRRGSRAIHEIA